MDKKEICKKRPMIKLHEKLFPCPTSAAMELIGGKWKSVILMHLMDGTKRYNELRKEIPTITDLISRKVYTKKPPLKVEYSLTDFSKSLLPVLEAISEWGIYAAEEKGEFIFEERE
jgi:DNA-binding HxlR family transcriptional regulator